MRKYFDALSPPSWIQSIIDNILGNMRITMKNFIIYYENFSILGTESVLKLRLEELDIVSTDSSWNEKFFSNSNVQYKILSISKLSLSLSTEPVKISKTKNVRKSPRNVKKPANIDAIYKKLREKEKDSFLLHPIDFQLNIKLIKHILTQVIFKILHD